MRTQRMLFLFEKFSMGIFMGEIYISENWVLILVPYFIICIIHSHGGEQQIIKHINCRGGLIPLVDSFITKVGRTRA